MALNFTCGSWPPQGNEIVFSAHVRRDEHSTIWVVHSTTSGLKRSDSAKPRRPEVRRYCVVASRNCSHRDSRASTERRLWPAPFHQPPAIRSVGRRRQSTDERRIPMRKLIVLSLLAGLALAALFALPAGASAPGVNGQIVFSRFDPAAGDTFRSEER